MAHKSPTSVVVNGTVQAGNDISLAELTSPNKKSERSRRGTNSERIPAARSEADNLDAGLNHSARRVRGRRSGEKEAAGLPGRRRGRSRGTNRLLSERISREESEAGKLERSEKRIGRPASSEKSIDDNASAVTPARVGSTRPKRGRSLGYRGSVKRRGIAMGGDVPVNGSSGTETTPSADIATEKQIEDTSDLEKKPLSHLARKLLGVVEGSGGSPKKFRSKMGKGLLTDSEGKQRKKPGRKPKSAGEGEASKKRQASKSKLEKSGVSSEDNGVSERNLKVSS